MSDEEFSGFKINKEYAKKYDKFREQEELQKLKAWYGDISGDSNSSSSESEDEDAEGLTPTVEKAWLKTLAAIKFKDPKIYNAKEHFYNEESSGSASDDESSSVKKKSSKPMYLKDYERKVILEKGGIISEDDSDSDKDEKSGKEYIDKPGYYEEQQEILDSFKKAVESDSDEDSSDELLTKRDKSKKELEKEEKDYIEWLKGQKEEVDEEAGKALNPLKDYWNDPKLPEGEKFLRDYILNKRYLEEDEGLPTYDEIVEEEDLSEEDKQIEKEEQFELKYNFRFEDPDTEFIKKYPRTIDDSVRRKDTKRSDKRKEMKEKKQKEKEKMKEDIKQLKNLKKKEILNKIKKLKHVAGEEDLGLGTEDLEADFDPEAHDKLMKRLFNKEYYQQEEDDEKPTWSDDEELGLNEWDEWIPSAATRNVQEEESEEDSSNDEDAGSDDIEHQPGTMGMNEEDSSDRELDATKKIKKKSKFQKVIESKKPTFNPDEKTFAEYLEEYYKLDYEDIVGGQTCRFKYRNVMENDFGLTTDEVLAAKEKELNRWVSIKKMSQYRTEEDEIFDQKLFSKKGKNEKHKMNILLSLQKDGIDGDEVTDTNPNQGKKKRKRKKKKGGQNNETLHAEIESKNKAGQTATGKAKKMKLFDDENTVSSAQGSTEDKPETNSTKGKKRKHKDMENATTTESEQCNTEHGNEAVKKKKKKHKKDSAQDNTSQDSVVVTKHEKKKKKKAFDKSATSMSEDRLKAYGIDPKKFKYTQHVKKKNKS